MKIKGQPVAEGLQRTMVAPEPKQNPMGKQHHNLEGARSKGRDGALKDIVADVRAAGHELKSLAGNARDIREDVKTEIGRAERLLGGKRSGGHRPLQDLTQGKAGRSRRKLENDGAPPAERRSVVRRGNVDG